MAKIDYTQTEPST